MRWLRSRHRKRDDVELERAEEIQAHIDLLTEQLIARGRTPEQAAREARLEFGNPRVTLEAVNDVDRMPILESLAFDARSAVRSLRAAPGFTAVVLAVLTLAMGASTAVFTVVDAVALRPLPFADSERIVAMDLTSKGRLQALPMTAPDFLALRDLNVFEAVAAVAPGSIDLRRDAANSPEAISAERVSAEFFSVLRVQPAIGRAFTRDDETASAGRVAIISYRLWQRRFGGRDVIGQHLPATGGDIDVIGVMPRDFAYPVGTAEPTEAWIPYVVPERERANRVSAYLKPIARLTPGATIADAHAQIDALDLPVSPKGVVTVGREGRLTLQPLRDSIVGQARPRMVMLLAAVACVLLVACVNIANLLMVRASVRVRELSVRTALGASRAAIARMLLAESLLLSLTGTVLGAVVAWWCVNAAQALLPWGLPRASDIALDFRVLGVAAMVAVVTGVAFGLAPVWHSSATIDQTLRAHARADTPPRRTQWARTALLVAEVALAVVLLVGTSLFLTSFAHVARIDVGLDYRNVLLVNVTRGDGATLSQIAARVAGLPGVVSATVGRGSVPFSFSATSAPLSVPGLPDILPIRGVITNGIAPDYFRTLGTRVLRGRTFTATEESSSGDAVVVLNDSAAAKYFPNQDPVGKVVQFKGLRTIVGVVEDVRGFGPEQEADTQAFLPIAQWDRNGGTLIVKTTGDPLAAADDVKKIVWAALPDLIIPPPQTLAERYGIYISTRRFNMIALSLFGFLGVTIAAIGVYGVMAFVVNQRTREIGIRMALGAQRSAIVRSVLIRASLQVGAGIVAGLSLAWMLTTSIEAELFRVAPHDVRLYLVVGAILIVAALAAALLPARRAANVDPLMALRTD